MWLSELSVGLWTKGSLVCSPVRAHAWVVDQVPRRGCVRSNHTLMFLPLSFSLPLFLKINNKIFKKIKNIGIGGWTNSMPYAQDPTRWTGFEDGGKEIPSSTLALSNIRKDRIFMSEGRLLWSAFCLSSQCASSQHAMQDEEPPGLRNWANSCPHTC